MFTSTNPSPQPSPRLDGERVLFPFDACVKMHPTARLPPGTGLTFPARNVKLNPR
jgi:hypothetical protein